MQATSPSSTPKQSWLSSTDKRGAYKRKESQFRNVISAGGEFPPEAGRYHLFVSYACPWAHRTLALRSLKGLDDAIGVTVVDHFLGKKGWSFQASDPAPGELAELTHLRQVYERADPEYDGNITVPVLWDKQRSTIVNNESSEIIRMLNHSMNDFCKTDEQRALDFYPEDLRPEIDEVNSWVYPNINNGVYKCGFAVEQEPYDEAFDALFEHLDKAEEILGRQRYLAGDRFTEADIRLFTTLVRFDAVYVLHFKCNKKRIVDYPNLWGYTREIYQMPGIAETVNMHHIKHHYMRSHESINPHRIVARGPEINFDEPHGRD